ncbi:DNA primase [Actinoplanes sp. NBRC 103695]|uniref:DNA primase n=1 Tax=Actinoplanes sp. NBRC 103695 TaxID=3032202 RepID=UPI00255257F0|nr:DNA primase [Actinoplanes sp. NBRC 103695]
MQTNPRRPFGRTAFLDRLRRRRLIRRYEAHGWRVLDDDVEQGQIRLATGLRFDALAMPDTLGLRILGTTRLHAELELPDLRGPVLGTPTGSWLFLVRPGTPLRSDLEDILGIVRHGRGSWVPAAPGRTAEGPIRWVVTPERVGWRLPASTAVQDMLADRLTDHPMPPRITVPRQVSTDRRAA